MDIKTPRGGIDPHLQPHLCRGVYTPSDRGDQSRFDASHTGIGFVRRVLVVYTLYIAKNCRDAPRCIRPVGTPYATIAMFFRAGNRRAEADAPGCIPTLAYFGDVGAFCGRKFGVDAHFADGPEAVGRWETLGYSNYLECGELCLSLHQYKN